MATEQPKETNNMTPTSIFICTPAWILRRLLLHLLRRLLLRLS